MGGVLGAFQKIEISGSICFETGAVAVAGPCRNAIAVKIFIVISFAIVVEIVQDRDLVAAKDVNLIANDFQSERLKKPGRETFPGQLLKFGIDAADAPDITVRGANGCVPVRKEIVTAREHEGVPRILIRNGQGIDQEWAGAEA